MKASPTTIFFIFWSSSTTVALCYRSYQKIYVTVSVCVKLRTTRPGTCCSQHSVNSLTQIRDCIFRRSPLLKQGTEVHNMLILSACLSVHLSCLKSQFVQPGKCCRQPTKNKIIIKLRERVSRLADNKQPIGLSSKTCDCESTQMSCVFALSSC